MYIASIIASLLLAATAEGPLPLPPPLKQCRCPAGYPYHQSAACCIRIVWPEECSPCLNGCVDSTCLDEPYVGEDGLPLSVGPEDECSLVEVERSVFAECLDEGVTYAWRCDDQHCLDDAGVYWRDDQAAR